MKFLLIGLLTFGSLASFANNYKGTKPKYTCGAQIKYYTGNIYEASADKKKDAKKASKSLCAKEENVEKCKWVIYCENNETGMVQQYF